MIARPAFRSVDELQRCGEVLSRYWVLAIPPAVVSFVVSIVVGLVVIAVVGSAIAGALAGHVHPWAGAGIGLGLASLLGLGGVIVCFAALNISQAIVIRASADALAERPPDLAASLIAVLPRLGDLSISMLASFAILLLPLLLSIVVVGLPFLACAVYFLIYVQAAVILGGEDGLTAIRTSFRMARDHAGETLALAVGIIIVTILGIVANAATIHIPIISSCVSIVIGGLTSAYTALASARFYLAFRDPSHVS